MDSFLVYPPSWLLSPQQREEGMAGSEAHLETEGGSPSEKASVKIYFNSCKRNMENSARAREMGGRP